MNILEKIAINKRLQIEELKLELPLKSFIDSIPKEKDSSFKNTLSDKDSINIIAEIKKGSPSKGIIQEDFDPARYASLYKDGGADAISVLTESKYFFGHYDYIKVAKDNSDLPILCKDFIVDKYQIYHARYIGASAVLLIVRLLDKYQLKDLLETTDKVGLSALVEVHDYDELNLALDCGADLIGVNNRNLDNFEVTLETSVELAKGIPNYVTRVAESGIFKPDDIRLLKDAGYNNFLIGEALMKQSDPIEQIKRLKAV